MKKQIWGILSLIALSIGLAGCGNSKNSKENTLTVGASNVPHAQILKHIQPELKKEGINLKIVTFQDYVMPNKALANKELDANYFQHAPFLDNWNHANHGDLVNVGKIHLEPIGIYSKKVKNLKDLKNNSTVLVSNNTADYGRVLQLFKDAGLITIKKGVNITAATFDDIATNPKHLKFKHNLEPKLMPQFYQNGEGDAVVINSNYAVQAGLDPRKDAISLEKDTSPYANIIAVRKADRNQPAIKKLVQALKSKSTQKWINNKYKGAVIPVKSDK